MKHLKVRGELVFNRGYPPRVKVTVLSQTHFHREFAEAPAGQSFKYGGRCMVSARGTVPCYGGGETIWLGHDDRYGPRTFGVTLKSWQIIKEMVAEYNRWGETQ